ncbi:MAG: hypothetical protein HY900_02625 [Deltaproteobacteria bacterium]|nr:hypothetical protein [Deltaproteobacteria bacterium]
MRPAAPPSSLRLLVCRLGGLRLAVEAERVRTVAATDPAPSGLPWFDELVPCPGGCRGPGAPRAVTLRGAGPLRGFLVSELEDVVTVTASELRPLPSLVARFASRYGLRGIALLEGTPAFLFDVGALRLHGCARPRTEGAPE